MLSTVDVNLQSRHRTSQYSNQPNLFIIDHCADSVLKSPQLYRQSISPVYMKIVLGLLLLLNHSVMFGAMAAADMPDEAHPFGTAVNHEHLHHHSHDKQPHASDQHSPVNSDQAQVHDELDPHHEHGMHIQLNMDLPSIVVFEFRNQTRQQFIASYLSGKSQIYSPPVPPPNS